MSIPGSYLLLKHHRLLLYFILFMYPRKIFLEMMEKYVLREDEKKLL